MTPPKHDALLEEHKRKYSFYYHRAEKFESTAMNAICWLNECITLAVHSNRKHLPAVVLKVLEKTTVTAEAQFVEVSSIIRKGYTYRSLTDEQREAMEKGCLRIEFAE